MHHLNAVFFLLLTAVFTLQAVTITGIVTTEGGSVLPGATVALEKSALITETDSSGRFIFSDIIAGTRSAVRTIPGDAGSITRLSNGSYKISVQMRTALKLEVFNAGGRLLFSVAETVGPGDHMFAMPALRSGLQICRITFNRTTGIVTSVGPGTPMFIASAGLQTDVSSGVTAAGTAAFKDILVVRGDNLLTYKREVTDADTGSLEIVMIPLAGTVTDIDGNEYPGIRLGTQVWTTENLRTARYRDGTVIPLVQDSVTWLTMFETKVKSDACSFYDNDTANLTRFGMLYNWYAASSEKLPPEGWRVPSASDWTVLERYLDNTYVPGVSSYIAKTMAARIDWKYAYSDKEKSAIGNDLTKNNISGFSALPAGHVNSIGGYYSIYNTCSWWSTTETDSIRAEGRGLNFMACGYLGSGGDSKYYGFSVRLVRDLTPAEAAVTGR